MADEKEENPNLPTAIAMIGTTEENLRQYLFMIGYHCKVTILLRNAKTDALLALYDTTSDANAVKNALWQAVNVVANMPAHETRQPVNPTHKGSETKQ